MIGPPSLYFYYDGNNKKAQFFFRIRLFQCPYIQALEDVYGIEVDKGVDKNDNSESTSCQSNVNLDNHENEVEDMLLKQIEILQEEIKIKNEQIEQLHKLLDQEQQLRMVSEQKKLEIEDSKEEKEEQKETKKKWWKFW